MASLNQTPSSERVHIAVFGKRNAGKSSLINAITGQTLSIVSEVAGTTTDPVYKTMEILPMGPVVLIDTAGIDDDSDLGQQRVLKTKEVLRKTDIAVLVVDSTENFSDDDILGKIKERNIPYIIVYNKCDLLENVQAETENTIFVSSTSNYNIGRLKEKIANLPSFKVKDNKFVEDLTEKNDIIILVMPQGAAAPKSRLILPEQQAVRGIIDKDGICVSIKDPWQLPECMGALSKKPKLVITDSQVFEECGKLIPDDICLTSFSILMAKYRGTLEPAVKYIKNLENLSEGDSILICEGCTHHRQCDDIGTVKIPNWIKEYTHKNFNFSFTSGREFPENIENYKFIIHCGGCMLNDNEMQYRYGIAEKMGVPMTNYGVLIAYIHGILERSLRCLPEVHKFLQ